jgi:tetratricopeptide (TPR) repeat protein
MKKIAALPALAAISAAAFIVSAACAGGPAATVPMEGMSLDEGITRIALDLEAGLPEGRRVVVVNFQSPSAYFSDYVLEELESHLMNSKKLVVMVRSKLELLRNEIEFQMSYEVSDKSAVSVGRWLGAQVIVTGRFTDIGGAYRCRFNAIDIETAEGLLSPMVTVRNDRNIADKLSAESAPPAQVPAKPDPLLAVAYFNAGFAHYEAGRYTEAVADFTRALEVKKDDEASLRYRAYSYYYLKDYDRSIADSSRLIEIQPGNAESYLNRGAAYAKKLEYDRAIADCSEALRINPNLAEAYNNRGVAYNLKGEHDRAIADCNEALLLNPNLAEAYNIRGAAYVKKGEHDRAIADCNEALRLNPNLAEAYCIRGAVYLVKREYDRAMSDLEKALQLDPTNADIGKLLELFRGMGL